jgi:branched-chain amino acid transport system substrate-binding protein
MNRQMKCTTLVLITAVILAAGSGCSRSGAVHDAYRIGVIGPLTGEGASYGEAMKQGIDMAIEEVNGSGGVNGHSLEAVYEDDKLLPKEGVAAFNKLVSTSNVPVIIGSAASRVTLSIAPMAQERHVVLFSSISTADELQNAGDYIFRDVPTNSMQGKTAAAFVSGNLHAPNVAILYKNDDYGTNLAASFRADVKQAGIPAVFDEGYDPIQKDFRNIVSRLQAAKPAVVFFPGNYQDNALILKQAREAGLTVPFVGGDGGFSEELFKIAGDASQNSYFTMMGIPKSPKVQAFVATFAKKYGTQEPNVFVYYAYDALMIVADAIKRGGYTSDGIKTALGTTNYDGLTGPTHFEHGGVKKPFSIYKTDKGKFEVLDWRPGSAS